MFYITFPVLIYLINGSLYLLTIFLQFSLPQPLVTTNLISFFMSWGWFFFSGSTYKWDHIVLVFVVTCLCMCLEISFLNSALFGTIEYFFLLWYFLVLKRFYLFLERGREGEREGEKHQCVVASHAPPSGDLSHNPDMCPDWEWNQWPFGSLASAQSTEPYQPGPFFDTLFLPFVGVLYLIPSYTLHSHDLRSYHISTDITVSNPYLSIELQTHISNCLPNISIFQCPTGSCLVALFRLIILPFI